MNSGATDNLFATVDTERSYNIIRADFKTAGLRYMVDTMTANLQDLQEITQQH